MALAGRFGCRNSPKMSVIGDSQQGVLRHWHSLVLSYMSKSSDERRASAKGSAPD